ncbi:MAG: HD domain-containing protein [Desulfobacteraceae bacterium]|jgi:putative hydrolase of HD superfamily|nr:HD domain-containing protein [Desulfobacteraceae bacterium]
MFLDAAGEKLIADIFNDEVRPGQKDRFRQQIEFILEVDKLKHVLRQTILMDKSRQENSAEHSWHIALTVMVLSEYARDAAIDFFKVMKILLIHDLIEIDAGDTYCYDDRGRTDQAAREKLAADRIFSILPPDQSREFRDLWDEFEERKTPESRFANALDRVQPFLHNYFTRGQTWQENDIKSGQVKTRMRPVDDGAPVIWNYVSNLIGDAVEKGFLAE